jgi:hypothetical protein
MHDDVRTMDGWEVETDPASPRPDYHTHHDPASSAKISTTVIHALADVMEVDVTETGFALYDSVDPDALDQIFSPRGDDSPRAPGHVAFTVEGYRVTVYSTGEIVITPPAGPSTSAGSPR